MTIAEIDERIAVVRENLRELIEQAAAYSGAADDDLISNRIAEQEAKLGALVRARDALSRPTSRSMVDGPNDSNGKA